MKLYSLSMFLLSTTVIVSARPAVEAPQACISQEADVAEPNAVHLRVEESDARDPNYYLGFCSTIYQDCSICVNGVLHRTNCYHQNLCTHINNACNYSLLTGITVCS
ncbi:uncharacterized protein BDW43DRAFT_273903 [Aspergillus alliaceus]|uniref:uncharacterized protein n=1 Tax=Petromyces alliaceus TaxID=209559 RepID=UPI0012A3F394|nr:uncharacterized protein BDW43DRAFT_273903 [Aspergillus alliaceus]KAB8234350.1 hypothetical protein BDW43DRAFT_273903 [Aspergillus alliaceus]